MGPAFLVAEQPSTVLVTGGAGFLGRPLVAALVRAGYAVRATTRQRTATLPAEVERVLVPDFTGPVDWDAVVRGANMVVHAAGLAHTDTSETDEGRFDRVNRAATQDLCGAAARAGVQRVVFIS
jgi:UDP-glucose 4-epimerase